MLLLSRELRPVKQELRPPKIFFNGLLAFPVVWIVAIQSHLWGESPVCGEKNRRLQQSLALQGIATIYPPSNYALRLRLSVKSEKSFLSAQS